MKGVGLRKIDLTKLELCFLETPIDIGLLLKGSLLNR